MDNREGVLVSCDWLPILAQSCDLWSNVEAGTPTSPQSSVVPYYLIHLNLLLSLTLTLLTSTFNNAFSHSIFLTHELALVLVQAV